MSQMSRPDPGSTTSCYSNGVVDVVSTVDGGTISDILTKPDGRTVCFKVLNEAGSAVFHYYDGTGKLVATVEALMPNSAPPMDYAVTCDGVTTVVTAEQQQRPECLFLSRRDCTPGVCP